MSLNPRPKPSVKNQGNSANSSAVTASPIQPRHPADKAPAPATLVCKDMKGPGAGTRGETGSNRSIPPRL
jgi:hypothetical protein